MADNSWIAAHRQQPTPCNCYNFYWVQFDDKSVVLIRRGVDIVDWSCVTYWQPTQIRTPKPLQTI